jgi:hypothetical protein
MKHRMLMSMLFPLLAVIVIAGYAGGLGVAFILINETELEEVGVIILGMVILIAVPATAAVVQQIVDKE